MHVWVQVCEAAKRGDMWTKEEDENITDGVRRYAHRTHTARTPHAHRTHTARTPHAHRTHTTRTCTCTCMRVQMRMPCT